MNFKLSNLVAATLAGSMLMGFGANAMADSTTDIVNALVSKGVLTEEEGALLTKGRTDEAAGQAKAIKKAGKLKISDAIDSATVYGDIRVRYEDRSGSGPVVANGVDVNSNIDRARYKMTLGVKTESGDFYTDLAMAMGASGRSDNATFGKTAGTLNAKEALFIKRAMIGYKATDWLTVEAGRMENPLYTTPMVWDADLTVEGLSEKFKYKANDNLELFGVAGQWAYKGERQLIETTVSSATPTNELFAFQGGAKYTINDRTSAKAAMTYSSVSSNNTGANFKPGTAKALYATNSAVNDLDTIEIPAEINYMATSSVGVRLFGDYVYNTSGKDRFNKAVLATAIGTDRNAVAAAGNDDTAWMLGVAIGSAKDLKAFEGNKMAKGDWSARLWYQDVGAYSVDQNAVDSDIFDSRVNMKGTILKAQYNVQDNVFVNFAYGHGTRKNGLLAAAGSASDLNATLAPQGMNLSSFDLVQLDLTYKF